MPYELTDQTTTGEQNYVGSFQEILDPKDPWKLCDKCSSNIEFRIIIDNLSLDRAVRVYVCPVCSDTRYKKVQ